MDGIRAYGSGMAASGGAIDWISLIKKPAVICRLVAALLAVLVWACISNSWHHLGDGKSPICLFGGPTSSTCSFGSFVSFISLVAAIGFTIADAYFDRLSSVQHRKRLVMTDFAVSAILTAVHIITFIVLWWRYGGYDLTDVYNGAPPSAAIFFSLLSALAWAGVTLYSWRRYMEGASMAFAPSYDQDFANIGGADYGYGGGPAVNDISQSYQEPPFTASNAAASAGAQYHQQAY